MFGPRLKPYVLGPSRFKTSKSPLCVASLGYPGGERPYLKHTPYSHLSTVPSVTPALTPISKELKYPHNGGGLVQVL